MTETGIIFLGQKHLGEECYTLLQEKLSSEYKICAVVTNTDTNVWWGTRKIADESEKAGIPVIPNASRNEDAIYSIIQTFNIKLMISVQHPWILSSHILETVDMALNLHNAKLPEYKGYNTIHHAILNRETSYTSTIHWMIPEVDMGPIAFEKNVSITDFDTAKTLHLKAHQAAFRIFNWLIDAINTHSTIPQKEQTANGTFYRRQDVDKYKEIHALDDINEAALKARAFYNPPFESAFFKVNDRKYYIIPEEVKI